MTATFRGVPLQQVRSRWNRRQRGAPGDGDLRVTLLASYTIDPLVPYLGVGLLDADLATQISVGPYNQIVQQCVDDTSEAARSRPDVLVVVPRFEEVSAGELRTVADAALAAAKRWRACLVFVLPALPDDPLAGAGDHASPVGAVVTAGAARERIRSVLAAESGVHLADAEAVVRAVGSRHAHHPSLYEYAKIPYTEEVFAGIADQVARLLRLRFAVPARAVVVDADALLLTPDGGTRTDAAPISTAVRELHDAGVRVALRSAHRPEVALPGFAAVLGTDWPDLVDDWVVDDRPAAEQLADLAASAELSEAEVAVLSDGSPQTWRERLLATGLLDVLRSAPAPADPTLPATDTVPVEASEPGSASTLSLGEYVASLDVSVGWRPARPDDVPRLVEMVLRTKDFALGRTYPETALAAWLAEESTEVALADVRDRLGDYGLGAAVAMRFDGGTASVELMLVSCPALGKGVEDAALGKIRELAEARRCDSVTFRCHETGRNGLALDFLRRAAEREVLEPTGPRLSVATVADG